MGRRHAQPAPNNRAASADSSDNGCLAKHSQAALVATCLLCSIGIAVGIRVVKSVRFGTVLDEHDSYFNQRVAQKMLSDGLIATLDWFDETVWYPFGRHVGSSILPGLAWSTALLHKAMHLVGAETSLETLCVYFPPFTAAMASLVGFAFAVEVQRSPVLRQPGKARKSSTTNAAGTGLFCALLLAVTPGMIQRTLSGNYDNECLGVVAMLWFFREWLVAVRYRSVWSALRAGFAGFLLASTWGGYAFAINVIALHSLVLVVLHARGSGRPASTNDDGDLPVGNQWHNSKIPPGLYQTFSLVMLVASALALLIPFHTQDGGVSGFFTSVEHLLPMAVMLYFQFSAVVGLLFPGQILARAAQRLAVPVTLLVILLAMGAFGSFCGGRNAWLFGFWVRLLLFTTNLFFFLSMFVYAPALICALPIRCSCCRFLWQVKVYEQCSCCVCGRCEANCMGSTLY